MNRIIKGSFATLVAGTCFGGSALAADIDVQADIVGAQVWTANNRYHLQGQIFVEPGAALTIEAGTVISSDVNHGFMGPGGSAVGKAGLAVRRGGQIFVQGTASNPVIFTSIADTQTWIGGDPKTGTWRPVCQEWGNLTIMGEGYCSENGTSGNTAVPNAANLASMEGLIADEINFPGRTLYGGGDDDDDSGSIEYASFRFGGQVTAIPGVELNGLSLGAIGRNTDIHHVEIMNNVDDGIEIWGGTVNLKHFSIWNIGDDSLDVDQGWRGKAQFGLIVQGYSRFAGQGGGTGDNCIEMDGAENSDWQPVTTSTMYNLTVIGQPISGDHGTAWRDNARVQIRNSIFMDLGERLVGFDNVDGDGAQGYGHNGTLDWPTTWTTAAGTHSAVNAPAMPGDFYTVQTTGRLIEITDSVVFRNLNGAAYTEANNRGVFDVANNNVNAGSALVDMPIMNIVRGPVVTTSGSLQMLPVTCLDPRPANDALVSVAAAPNDGFFTPAMYRGAFEPAVTPWTAGWTASDAFGFTTGTPPYFCESCMGDGGNQLGCTNCPCSNNAPIGTVGGCLNPAGLSARLRASGVPSVSADSLRMRLTGGQPASFGVLTSGSFLQPSNPANPCFGLNTGLQAAVFDGLRCTGGTVIRHGSRAINAAGEIGTTGAAWGLPNGPTGGLVAASTGVAGGTRHFQVIYRVNVTEGCMRGQNTSQAVSVNFVP